MSTLPPEDINYFEAPRAEIGGRASNPLSEKDDNETELTRLYHLSHENSIKAVGLLAYLGAAVGALCTLSGILIALGLMKANQPQKDAAADLAKVFLWLGAVVWLTFGLVSGAIGFGLRRFQFWSRWTAMVLAILAMLFCMLIALIFLTLPNPLPAFLAAIFTASILGYIFFLLVSPKAGVIFSPEYRIVIEKTPWIKSSTSLIVKILIALLIALLALVAIVMIGSIFVP